MKPDNMSDVSGAMKTIEQGRGSSTLGGPAALLGGPVPARTLLDIFSGAVARHAHRTAIDTADATLTYAELTRAADGVAERLRDADVGPGERVGIQLASGCSSLYVGILGVLRAGAAYVPVDADDPPARAETIWEGADVCGVLQEDLQFARRRPAADPTSAAAADGGNAADRSRSLATAHPSAGDDAWIIFTSGSTGAPKGVAVSHRAAAAFVNAEARLWTVAPEDRVLAGLSVSFDASCEEMWLAWANGAALVPAPRELIRTGVDLGPWLAERRVSVISTVPTLAAMWSEEMLAGVRLLILGGEACPPELAVRLATDEREVWNTYGPTEATVVSTATRLQPGTPVTIGWPLHGWEVAVVDEAGVPVALGETGELVIGGVGLGRYLDPRLDRERYAALPALGWERAYRSGDLVRETVHGYDFVGRRDHQVKLAGRRLELGEVEARLAAVNGVRAAAVAVQSTAAANKILVGYVVGEVDPADVRAQVAEQLPDGLEPLVVVLDALPIAVSGKVDRKALPWPLQDTSSHNPDSDPSAQALTGTAAWLAERWIEQLGPLCMTAEADFFACGGSSVAAAKLVSVLRERFPTVAVADVYEYRGLAALAARLDELGEIPGEAATAAPNPSRRLGAMQLAGVLALTALASTQWVIAALGYGNIESDGLPHVGWGWLIGAWLALASPLGRVGIAAAARRLLLPQLRPGRYPRDSWLACRVWFLERLGEFCHLDRLAGTPAAARYARMIGADIGAGARLASMPSLASLVRVGAGATVESQVDLRGWWVDGQELVVGEVEIGVGASVGARTLLGPGAAIGEGAEIEPGSVVSGAIPAGEHWGGSPARRLGRAGADWPAQAPSRSRHARFWKLMFALSFTWEGVLVLLALAPGLALLVLLGAPAPTLGGSLPLLLGEAAVLAVISTVTLALLVALTLRVVWKLVRPGWHPGDGALGWALWFSGDLQETAGGALFPLYASLYTRRWLRLMGIRVGRRSEISTSTGLNPLVSFGEFSHATDDVAFVGARARGGWLHVEPIEVGSRTFLGPGSVLREGTRLGDDSLLGVLTLAPREPAVGTSWFGVPALELPRVCEVSDPTRTTEPPRRLIFARGTMDAIRIFVPNTISLALGLFDLVVLDALGGHFGIPAMIALCPLLVLCSGLFSAAIAVALKWLVIGRYRPGQHPLWSLFVWRDELVNSAHEQLAGEWLLRFAIGTPLMSLYLRAMGSKVGRGAWCETTAITEFDVVTLEDDCAVNRGSCLMTHVFHDRLLRIGPARIGAGATMGPTSAVLPDTTLGVNTCIGGHSVVLRGETLPAGTRWHGAPVKSV
jgi:non-ribosomal peptide synthetase-like protein